MPLDAAQPVPHDLRTHPRPFIEPVREGNAYLLDRARLEDDARKAMIQAGGPFPGIDLRISLSAGPIVVADSLRLHYLARYAGHKVGGDDWYTLLRMPWLRMSAAEGSAGLFVPKPTELFVVELRPTMLTDVSYDDPEC
jgi:hypothetical protein